MKSQSYRRQSAPSMVISKALIRSKTISRSFLLHGNAQLKTGMQTQDRHLFLFSDLLVIAKANSAEQKERWLSLLKERRVKLPLCFLSSRIKEEKEKEEPKTIPLRVYGKGINTFAITKTLPVSNSDSANEVIRLALQQFGIIGNVKDFQLWVISKRDNAPYPLIGHEFPFSIQMSHVRQTGSRGGEQRGRQTGGADAGVQAVPVHYEASNQ
ncbi:hypothetical protein F7725_008967 [Dissostichus mawsoni]|uniref:Ras-associating domain-containing protein n=1 Tax=Dissostichus mawsoni TaxID=36200 RepID=A0A7J5Z9U0_DISMA|nr:hypothetical protein F7725_008967 [Dissostichus mawsoni]